MFYSQSTHSTYLKHLNFTGCLTGCLNTLSSPVRITTGNFKCIGHTSIVILAFNFAIDLCHNSWYFAYTLKKKLACGIYWRHDLPCRQNISTKVCVELFHGGQLCLVPRHTAQRMPSAQMMYSSVFEMSNKCYNVKLLLSCDLLLQWKMFWPRICIFKQLYILYF